MIKDIVEELDLQNEIPPNTIDMVFSKGDINHDGKISLEGNQTVSNSLVLNTFFIYLFSEFLLAFGG